MARVTVEGRALVPLVSREAVLVMGACSQRLALAAEALAVKSQQWAPVEAAEEGRMEDSAARVEAAVAGAAKAATVAMMAVMEGLEGDAAVAEDKTTREAEKEEAKPA